ncbi:uncharacterized protein LOC122398965 [Colletes gigas]|uniref:uncharacterized protein LOC122398965 n=1 Tax=Colletes gigas TaxID=935657 RepID=UPI001C9A59A7|nr:uncharacterized protein LOC122398965 [Colletes gigas]
MFYSADLLSLRRRGKLARCWLAATVSEAIFKKTCRSASITKIDVAILCGEILSTVQIRDSDNYCRFSLYLSSQLMYGATKIRFYQTKLLQDEVFSLNIKLIQMNRHGNQFNLPVAFKEPDDLPVHRMLHDLASPLKLHLITEEPYTSLMEHLMQDEKSFGMLTDFEMDKFLLPEAEEQQKFLNEIRRFDWNESILLPLGNCNTFEFDLPNAEEEIRMLSARKDQGELEINEETQFKQPAPATPKKRSTKSRSETPTKKRKLSSAEVPILEPSEVLALKPSEISTLVPPEVPAPAPSEVLPLPFPEEYVLQIREAIAQMAAVEHASEFEIQLPAIENSELIRAIRPKRRRKLFDTETSLPNTVMRSLIANVAAHTTQHHLHAANTLPSANEYLTQPALKLLNRPWAESLTKSFKRHLNKPSAVLNEFLDFDIDPKSGETIRPDTSNKSHVQVEELFSKIGITTTETSDHSKTLKELHSIIECYPTVPEEQQRKEIEEPSVPLLEVTDIEEKFRETTPQLSRRKTKDKSMLSDTLSFNNSVTKREFLALLEILWHDTSVVKFHDVIPPSNYNKTDAACTFYYCLEYYAEKVIILTQTESFGPIFIRRHPSESSDDSNAHTT